MAGIAVIGAANIDIQGTPYRPLEPGDSNPGRITVNPGGVGRNIAENAARLGLQVSFISVFGDDDYSARIIAGLRSVGVDIGGSLVLADRASPAYLCLLDADGRLHVAVSDMKLADEITPELIDRCRPLLASSRLCVLDANLRRETIEHVARSLPDLPLLFDPVSAAKAARGAGIVGRLRAVKPNRREAEILTGIEIRGEEDLDRAAALLHGRGTESVFISLGEAGLYFSGGGARGRAEFSTLPAIRSTNGAGDATTAAIAYGIVNDWEAGQTARFALGAGSIAAESDLAVNPDLDLSLASERALRTRVVRR